MAPRATWSENSSEIQRAVYQTDGINLNREHLGRSDAVSDIIGLARQNRFVVVGAPPAMGKTSLLQLVKKEVSQRNGVKVLHRGLSASVDEETVKDRLRKYGIIEDDESSTDDESSSAKYGEIWILLDDAQNWYGAEYWSFWQRLVKHLPVTCSTTFFVVIAATYDLSTHESPVQFRELEHYRQTSIQEEEVDQLIRMHVTDFQLQSWELYWDTVKKLGRLRDSRYHIGVILQGIRLLLRVLDLNKQPSQNEKDEISVVSLLRTVDFTLGLKRCFAVPENLPEAGRRRLVDVILHSDKLPKRNENENDELLAPYVRAGLLADDGDFSCRAAMWFYNSCCFPGRTWDVPATIDDLIIKSVSKLSANSLVKCLHQDGFPKEAALQHFFNEAMSMNLTNTNFLIPELNTWATDGTGDEISGELDYYINGSLQWCVELVRNGDKIGGHLDRFKPRTGKYRNVQAKDYLVVDCRPPKSGNGARIAPDRCNLFFEENFTKCRVQMRTKEEQIISLQP